jgi:hypothetical protein
LMLTGKTQTGSWMPPVLPAPDELFLNQVRALYAEDAVLKASLTSALALQASAQNAMDDPASKNMQPGPDGKPRTGGAYGDLTPLFQGAGHLLAAANGPRVATLEASGWDTHVAEGAGDGQLARRLGALDAAIEAMRVAMGPDVWNKTAVVMAVPAAPITARAARPLCSAAPSQAAWSGPNGWALARLRSKTDAISRHGPICAPCSRGCWRNRWASADLRWKTPSFPTAPQPFHLRA